MQHNFILVNLGLEITSSTLVTTDLICCWTLFWELSKQGFSFCQQCFTDRKLDNLCHRFSNSRTFFFLLGDILTSLNRKYLHWSEGQWPKLQKTSNIFSRMHEHSQIIALKSKAFLTVILIWHERSSAIIHGNQARKTNMQHQSEKCADCDKISCWRNPLNRNRELQSEEMKNWNHVWGRRPSLRQTETSTERKGGEAKGRRGWRHVKVSQDHMTGESWPHTTSCQKIWRILFLVTEGSPGRSF